MAVLVEGMEMPKSCWECYFQDCGNCVLNNYKVVDRHIIDGLRDDDCPLVEVLPHGDLIDADALVEFIENFYNVTWSGGYAGGRKDTCVAILEEIERLPTIIESED